MEHGLGHVQFQARVKRQVYSDDKLNAPGLKNAYKCLRNRQACGKGLDRFYHQGLSVTSRKYELRKAVGNQFFRTKPLFKTYSFRHLVNIWKEQNTDCLMEPQWETQHITTQ